MDTLHPQTQAANEFIEKISQLSRMSTPPHVSLAVQVDGKHLLSLWSEQPMRMMSVQKSFVALAHARKMAANPELAMLAIPLAEVDAAEPGFFDGGAHANWKSRIGAAETVTLDQVAEGMMRESSNACTQFMMNRLGSDKINAIIKECGLKTEPFGAAFTVEQVRKRSSALDMVSLMEHIATKEPEAVRTHFAQLAPHSFLSPAGEAAGFGKGGSGIMHDAAGNTVHDLNYAWHVAPPEGPRVSAAVFTNGIDGASQQYLEERLVPFMCETSCNASARNAWQELLKPSVLMESLSKFVGRSNLIRL